MSNENNKLLIDRVLPLAVSLGVTGYQNWCRLNDLSYHQSTTHTFKDTISQCMLASKLSSDPKIQSKLTELTCYVHLLDDMLDGNPNISYRNFGGDVNSLMTSVGDRERKVILRMLALTDQDKISGVESLISGLIFGALVYSSQDRDVQRNYCEKYQNLMAESIPDSDLRRDILKINPAVYARAVPSVGAEGFIAVSGEKNWATISPLFNCWFASMIHYHNRDEEQMIEGQRIVYGEELCDSNGKFRIEEMVKMIDVFDKHIPKYASSLSENHLASLKFGYQSFEKVLPAELKERYKLSYENCEKHFYMNERRAV